MDELTQDADKFRMKFKKYDLENNYTKESYDEFKREQQKHLKNYNRLIENHPNCLKPSTEKALNEHMFRSFDIETCTDETKTRSETGKCIWL